MARAILRTLVCPTCQQPFSRPVGRGRPSKYCTPACGAAVRRKPVPPPDPAVHQTVVEISEDIHQLANALMAAGYNDASSEQMLRLRGDLVRYLDDLEAALVRRGRVRGETWDALGDVLSISASRLRKKWTRAALERRLDKQRGTRTSRQPTRATGQRGSDPAEGRPTQRAQSISRTPRNQLACALSHLQRRSDKLVRAVAADAGISPSYVSKILAGVRRPSWPVTERLAHAYGINSAEVRPLWEAAHRADGPSPPPNRPADAAMRLHSTLRSLYLSAARPDLWTLHEATAGVLSIDHIARTLNGLHVPDWEATGRLVFALRGRPADIRPLWQAAAIPSPRTPGPSTPSGPPAAAR